MACGIRKKVQKNIIYTKRLLGGLHKRMNILSTEEASNKLFPLFPLLKMFGFMSKLVKGCMCCPPQNSAAVHPTDTHLLMPVPPPSSTSFPCGPISSWVNSV